MLGSGMALYDGIAALHESAPAGPQAEVYARLSENIAKTGSLGEALGRTIAGRGIWRTWRRLASARAGWKK